MTLFARVHLSSIKRSKAEVCRPVDWPGHVADSPATLRRIGDDSAREEP